MTVLQKTLKQRDELLAQRNELLAALAGLVDVVLTAGWRRDTTDLTIAVNAARDAIAKAEGKL